MLRIALVACALLLPTSAGAQTLWRNIELGMTIERLHALYPAGEHVKYEAAETLLEEVRITPECEAQVHIHHEAGTVDRVVLRGGGSMSGRCANRVLDALAARYGQAAAREERRGILRRPSQDHVWNHEGIMIRFRRFGGNDFGGGGLLRASWEISYSAVDMSIDV
jgi:hypothetical protein